MRYALKLKPASEVQIENTKTNRDAAPVESAMNDSLNMIASRIKQTYYQPLDSLLYAEMLVANESLNNLTRDTIKAAVQELYLLGTQYTNDAHKLNSIITDRDTANIKDIARDKQARFYYNVVNWINREKQIDQLEKTGIPTNGLTHLDIEGAIARITNVASTQAINYGTVDKLLQLNDKPRIQFTTQGAAKIPTYDVAIRGRPTLEPSGVTQKELNFFPETVVGTLVTWITAEDDKVCPECMALQGIIFDTADENMPIPPDDVHPNCRCRLMIIDPHIDLTDQVGTVFDSSVLFG